MRHAHILLYIVLIYTFSSCKKEPQPTFVKGEIVDSKTGAPISGAHVEFRIYIPKNHSPDYDQISETSVTMDDGTFDYVMNPRAEDVSPIKVYHPNYVTKNINFSTYKIQLATTNSFTIPMIRYNATLNVSVKNTSGNYDLINIVIENPTFLSEARSSLGKRFYYPLLLESGEEKSISLPLVADEYTKIYWDFTDFISNQMQPAHQDSVYLHVGEELNYSIFF
ncbi:MAG: hypothetical protein LCH81_18585 [Bacteroidetes bacterium]|nr:hypothetical protein [Bacteroidota bacterium]